MNNDSPAYQDGAKDLLDNGQLDEAQMRPIGYAIILILTDSVEGPNRALYLFQLILHAMTVSVVIYLLIKFDISRYGYLLFFIFAWLPSSVSAASKVLTETPTAFCLSIGIAGLLLYIKDGKLLWLIPSSVLLAFSAWVRPTYQYLSLTLVVFLLVIYFLKYFDSTTHRRLLVSSLVLTIGYFVIVGGYLAYNRANFGFTGLSPIAGFNLTTRTVRFVDKLPDEYAVEREILVKYRDRRLVIPNDYPIHTGYVYIWSTGAIPELMDATGLSFVELSQRLQSANIGLIIDNPLEYLIEVSHGLTRYWFPVGGIGLNSKITTLIWLIVHYSIVVLYLASVITLMIAVGFAFLFRKSLNKLSLPLIKFDLRIVLVAIVFMVVVQTGVISAAVDVGYPRHRIPVEMLIYASLLVQFSVLHNLYQNIKSFLSENES